MHLSRELAIEELESCIKVLEKWIEEIKNPSEITSNDEIVFIYPDGVPPMLSIAEIPCIHIPQFRSELAVVAGKLEAIAST